MAAHWVAFDTETTGLEPGSRLVELAAVAFDADGTICDQFEELIDPGIPLPPDVVPLLGLSDEDLQGRRRAREVLTDFRDWLPDDAIMVAHNARFDRNILSWEFERARRKKPRLAVADSLRMALALDGLPSGRLHDIVDHFAWQMLGDAHRALPDADATRQLVVHAQGCLSAERFAKACETQPFAGTWHYPRDADLSVQALLQAVESQSPISFTYCDADGYLSERSVTPYGMARTDQGLRFHGWCHLREDRRQFAFERASFNES